MPPPYTATDPLAAVQAPALADAPLLALLAEADDSVFPRAGAEPPAATPFIVAELGPETTFETGTATVFLRWRIFDEPIQGWARITAVAVMLQRLYPTTDQWLYVDSLAPVYRQEYAGLSERLADDGWHLHTQYLEWLLWRSAPLTAGGG